MEDQVVRNRQSRRRAGGRGLAAGRVERSLRRPRTVFSVFLTTLIALLTLVALVPLFSVVYMLLVRGFHKLSCRSSPRCRRPPWSKGADSATPFSAR